MKAFLWKHSENKSSTRLSVPSLIIKKKINCKGDLFKPTAGLLCMSLHYHKLIFWFSKFQSKILAAVCSFCFIWHLCICLSYQHKNTALHMAARGGHIEVVRYLCLAGTPLHQRNQVSLLMTKISCLGSWYPDFGRVMFFPHLSIYNMWPWWKAH